MTWKNGRFQSSRDRFAGDDDRRLTEDSCWKPKINLKERNIEKMK
jgi:hypothetical protein